MSSASAEVAALKQQVKNIIGQVNNLKAQLQNREIPLDEFKAQKEALEEQLRHILEEISKYKEKAPAENQQDVLLAEEARHLMYEFQTEFPDKISKALVYISASLDDHFVFDVDFSNYPKRPTIIFPNMLQKLFDVTIDTKFPLLNNWDPQHAPHLNEVFYEIERLLLNIFKSEEIEETDLNQYRIQKVLQRRKFIESAQYEFELKNYQNALDLYQKVIELSYELDDFEQAKKYSQKLAELKKYVGQ